MGMKLRGILRKKIMRGYFEEHPAFSMREPRNIIVLPSFKNLANLNVTYPLLEPYAFANIVWKTDDRKLKYNLVEPELSKSDKELLKKIEANITELIDIKISIITEREKAISYIQEKVNTVLGEMGKRIDNNTYTRLMYYIIRDFVGINELEPLMFDPYIEDIGCSGLNTPIYVIHRKVGSIETSIVFDDIEYLTNLIIKLSERCGRYISYASPLLDGTLPDGSRIQASLAKDVTTKGPTFTIRKFRKIPYSPTDIISLRTTSAEMMAYLWYLVQQGMSILICGGVSTGKTTLLNTLSMFIPPENKIISIEDTREISLPHENWIPSVSRTGFGIPEPSGKRYGEIDLFDLLKESFRQNPDYVIVGEIRGKEAYVMFQGMSSGHPSMGTIHAGSVDDVLKRLETPPIELSPSLIESLDAVIVMVNAREKGKSSRRVKEIVEVQDIDHHTGKAHTIKTFGWIPSMDSYKSDVESSEILRRISFEKGLSYKDIIDDIETRKRILEWMQRHDIIQYDDVTKIINMYYKDSESVLVWMKKDINPFKTSYKKKIEDVWSSATNLKFME